MPSALLGVVFHWLGGLASGSFYVPYKGVKKWSWETYWLVGGFFSWIICPWLLRHDSDQGRGRRHQQPVGRHARLDVPFRRALGHSAD